MENASEERYLLWLCFVTACDPRRCFGLMRRYGGARPVFDAAASGQLELLARTKNRDESVKTYQSKANEGYIDRCLEYLEKKHIDAVSLTSDRYPPLLREIADPPPVLFVMGTLKDMPLPIGVIGSRKCSEYGKRVALELSRELAERGATIISGLAHGIDCIASKGALASGSDCPTVAVLGTGVDVIYPKANARIYSEIVERGAVVSEFLPGTPAAKYTFPRRNRVISGMSRGVVVVEAAEKSGTFITVDSALDQGRDVFAVPGRVTDEKSRGTNRLISEGCAKAVNRAEDILSEYGFKGRSAPAPVDEGTLTYEQALVYRLLKAGERSFDELCELTGFSAGLLNSALTEMEFSGIIKQSPGRVFGL